MSHRRTSMSVPKRVFDLVGALVGLAALSPLMAVIALMLKAEDGGPVFFRQTRIGHRGKPFRVWKFRTMVPDADRRGLPLTVGDDSRVTRIGAWLRRLKLDELPQLLNVVAGHMSLVGPRPEVPRYVGCYSLEQRRVLDLVPGLTDEATLHYRNESDLLAGGRDPEGLYIEAIMPDKIRLSLAYAQRATIWSDARMILLTLRRVFGSPSSVSN
jgi:lipopolysaccharide/colanic/teichoic acid biosynthesis glycosyltransferase